MMRRYAHFAMLIGLLPLFGGWIPPVQASQEDEEESSPQKDEESGDMEDRTSRFRGDRFEIDGSLYTLFAIQDDSTSPDFGFSLERARVELTWQVSRHVKSVVEAALDDVTADGTPDDLLRDAFIRFAPLSELQFTAGQFKKPFSLFELVSRGKMPVIRRGVSNGYLVRDLGYGGRDIGFQVGGVFKAPLKIRYAVGIFNGSGANRRESDENGAKDFAGRIEIMSKKRFRGGVNLSWKNFDQTSPGNESKPVSAWMTGADFQLRLAGMRLMAEGIYGVNHASYGHPRAAGLHGLISWKFRLPRHQMFLSPVARLDWVWPVFSENRDSSVRVGTAGIHWQFEKLRLMLEYERTHGSGEAAGTWPDSESILLQLALDF